MSLSDQPTELIADGAAVEPVFVPVAPETIVLQGQDVDIVIASQPQDAVFVREELQAVFVDQPSNAVFITEGAGQGPQGRAGVDVLSQSYYPAAQALSAERIVRTLSTGQINYADNTDIEGANCIAGITLQAGLAGDSLQVQFAGTVNFSGWNWIPDGPLFLGANGAITQSRPTSGFLLHLGFAETPTRISLRIGRPIFLS